MGVYIEGAKLPKNCEECNFKVECRPYWEKMREQYTRPNWCPCLELSIEEAFRIMAEYMVEKIRSEQ